MDEKELALIKKAQNGDSEAMEALIVRYMWIARSKARKYFLSSGSYDDLLQEGLMGVFKAIRDFEPDKNDNFPAFISMCVGRQIMDVVRAYSRDKHRPLNEATAIEDLNSDLPSEYIYDPINNFITREGTENFYKILDSMLKPIQMAVLKYYFEGYTYSEISELTKMPTKKVDNILNQIKTKIKKNKELFE